MAFKGGTPIQAGLGRADFSGIERAGQYRGQAMANVGATLANAGMQAVQEYRMKEQEKAQVAAADLFLKKNSNMRPKERAAYINSVGVENLPVVIEEFRKNKALNEAVQQEQLAVQDILQKYSKEDKTFDIAGAANDPKFSAISPQSQTTIRLLGGEINRQAVGDGVDSPSSVKEFKFYTELPEEQKALFMQLKRAQPQSRLIETAEGKGIFNPVTSEITPLTTGEQEIAAAAKEKGATTEAGARAEAEVARDLDDPRKRQKAESLLSNIDNVIATAEESMDMSGAMTAGFGGLLKYIPTTDAKTLSMKLDTIRAALAFDRLQAMRDASQTGGALGQVSEKELTLLESATAKLDQLADPKDLDAQLGRIVNHYNTVKVSILARRYREIEELGRTPAEINSQMIAELGVDTAINIRGMYLEKEKGMSQEEVAAQLQQEFGNAQ